MNTGSTIITAVLVDAWSQETKTAPSIAPWASSIRCNILATSYPPQAAAGWLGEAGPGPSYLDPDSGGPENDFTNRNTTFMTWNLIHMARMLNDGGGIPAYGNQRPEWDADCRFDYSNPDYR